MAPRVNGIVSPRQFRRSKEDHFRKRDAKSKRAKDREREKKTDLGGSTFERKEERKKLGSIRWRTPSTTFRDEFLKVNARVCDRKFQSSPPFPRPNIVLRANEKEYFRECKVVNREKREAR